MSGPFCQAIAVGAGDFDLIFGELHRGQVRYLVVGGVAVVLHGHPRFTADLDLVVSLDPGNARAAIAALARLGYRPRTPVDGTRFSDPETLRRGIDEKGLPVFSLWSPHHPATDVDLFVQEPLPFDVAWARATMATGVASPRQSAAARLALASADVRPARRGGRTEPRRPSDRSLDRRPNGVTAQPAR